MQKNRIELAGYLATKPETRFLPSGTKVTNARLKESYRFTDSDGKQQTHANWHSLAFYGELADIALSFEKDDNIYVEGSLQQRKFTPADGVTRTVYEVHARSCHQIAAGCSSGRAAPLEEDVNRAGELHDDPSWPVGPAQSTVTAAIITGAVAAVFHVADIRVNASSSLPIGLYRITTDRTANLIEFCPAEPFGSLSASRGYRGRGTCPDGAEPLLKPIAAVAGDLVNISATGITINGKLLGNSVPRSFDTNNRPLQHWPFGNYRVAPGIVWVISAYNARSFDSRYFGPISVSSIRAHLQPFITE